MKARGDRADRLSTLLADSPSQTRPGLVVKSRIPGNELSTPTAPQQVPRCRDLRRRRLAVEGANPTSGLPGPWPGAQSICLRVPVERLRLHVFAMGRAMRQLVFFTRMREKYVPGAVRFPNDGHDCAASGGAEALLNEANAAKTATRTASEAVRTTETIKSHSVACRFRPRQVRARTALQTVGCFLLPRDFLWLCSSLGEARHRRPAPARSAMVRCRLGDQANLCAGHRPVRQRFHAPAAMAWCWHSGRSAADPPLPSATSTAQPDSTDSRAVRARRNSLGCDTEGKALVGFCNQSIWAQAVWRSHRRDA